MSKLVGLVVLSKFTSVKAVSYPSTPASEWYLMVTVLVIRL